MVGIVVLVMAGVGLSIVIDRRIKFSSGSVGIQNDIVLGASELDGLIALHCERSRLLSQQESKLLGGFPKSDGSLRGEENLFQRRKVLEDTRLQLLDSVSTLEADFSRCRADYRKKTWSAAIGERLGNLALRSGRQYHEATITRVTDVGLEIRHADGIARIQAPDLDQKMQDRFQWSEEERRKVLNEEMINLQRADDPVAGYPKPVERVVIRPQTRNQPDPGELVALRRQVTGWQLKISQLRSEQSVARSHSGYGNQTSVPGSLETWSAKADRCGRELARAQVALETAKSNLAAIAPSDSLLLSTPRDP